jgi:hypothetical protein
MQRSLKTRPVYPAQSVVDAERGRPSDTLSADCAYYGPLWSATGWQRWRVLDFGLAGEPNLVISGDIEFDLRDGTHHPQRAGASATSALIFSADSEIRV